MQIQEGFFDYRAIAEKAMEMFKDQSLLTKDKNEVTIKDLETSRLKSNNFLEAMGGMLDFTHKIELLSADDMKFKRKDELSLLNNLRKTCELQAEGVHKTLQVAIKRIEQMQQEEEPDPEKIALLQSVMQNSVDVSQKLIASTSRLIQLERYSGGRAWGHSSRAMTTNIKLIEHLNDEDGKTKPKRPREIDPNEVEDGEVL